MKRTDKTIVFVICICVVLFFIRLIIQTDLGTESDTYFMIEDQIKEQDAVNDSLKEKLYAREALIMINEEARQQGFIDVTKYYIVK